MEKPMPPKPEQPGKNMAAPQELAEQPHQQGQPDSDELPQADGEDAKLGAQLIRNIKDQIFSHASDPLMETLEAADDLPITIGQIASEILKSQLDAMKAVGKQLSQDVYLDAGRQIIENLYEMADAMGLIDQEAEGSVDQMMNESMSMATQVFAAGDGQQYLDPKSMQQFLMDAASGKFDNMANQGGGEMPPAMPPAQPAPAAPMGGGNVQNT